MVKGGGIKGTVEEELADVLYYLAVIANICEIDLESSFRLKVEINREKYK